MISGGLCTSCATGYASVGHASPRTAQHWHSLWHAPWNRESLFRPCRGFVDGLFLDDDRSRKTPKNLICTVPRSVGERSFLVGNRLQSRVPTRQIGVPMFAGWDKRRRKARAKGWMLRVPARRPRGMETLEDRCLLSVAPFGAEFPADWNTAGVQATRAGSDTTAVCPTGEFITVFHGAGPGDSSGVFAQRFDAKADRVGDELRANSTVRGTPGGLFGCGQ